MPNPKSDSRAVIDSIRQIVHALELGSRAAQKRLGLSGAQLFVLQTLASALNPMSINELAAETFTHQSSVSVVVSRLAEARLVKRSPASHDARRLELTVTPAGRRILQSGFITPQQTLLEALNQLPSTRLAQLRSLLDQVIALSGLHSDQPPMFFEKAHRRPPKASQ